MLARITDAARASFAENGWAGTTMRGVARAAGVDPALLHYYFSSKEELLDASTLPPPQWIAAIQRTNSSPLGARGEAIVRNLVWSWSQPEIRDVLSSVLMTAAHPHFPVTRACSWLSLARTLPTAPGTIFLYETALFLSWLVPTLLLGMLTAA
ncbi:MAG: helix-turn-helix domain-containing protein [Solirubrobacteraceae bacterium]